MVYIHAKSTALCVHLDNMVSASMCNTNCYNSVSENGSKLRKEHCQQGQDKQEFQELHSLRKQYLEQSYEELINNETPFVLLDAMMLLLHFIFTNNNNNCKENNVCTPENVKRCIDTDVIEDLIKECKNLYSGKKVVKVEEQEVVQQNSNDDDHGNTEQHKQHKQEGEEDKMNVSKETENSKMQSKAKLFTVTLHALTRRTAYQVEMLLSNSLLVTIFDTLELLWCLKFIVRHVKIMNNKRRQTLIGHIVECKNRSKVKNAKDEVENWERQCSYFHDDVVLLPFSFLEEFVSTWNKLVLIKTKEQQQEYKHEESTQISKTCKFDTISSVYDLLCGVLSVQTSSSLTQDGNDSNANCKNNTVNDHFNFIVNPAISPNDNPQRRLKNVRVAAIEDAAMKFYYDQLAYVASDNKSTSLFTRSSNNNNQVDSQRTMRLTEVSVIDSTQYNTQVTFQHNDEYKHRQQEHESFGAFVSNACIGFDIYIMSLSAAGAGFYLAYMLNKSIEVCLVCATVALVIMLFVDALLLLTRIGKEDINTNKSKRQRARARAKYTNTSQNKLDTHEKEFAVSDESKTSQGDHNNNDYIKKMQ